MKANRRKGKRVVKRKPQDVPRVPDVIGTTTPLSATSGGLIPCVPQDPSLDALVR